MSTFEERIAALYKAFEAGGFSTAPSKLVQGCIFEVEDELEVINNYEIQFTEPIKFVQMDFIIPAIKCECGSDTARLHTHSDWCPKNVR